MNRIRLMIRLIRSQSAIRGVRPKANKIIENVICTVAHLFIDEYGFALTGCWPFVCKTEFLIRECKCARMLCLETTVFKVVSWTHSPVAMQLCLFMHQFRWNVIGWVSEMKSEKWTVNCKPSFAWEILFLNLFLVFDLPKILLTKFKKWNRKNAARWLTTTFA